MSFPALAVSIIYKDYDRSLQSSSIDNNKSTVPTFEPTFEPTYEPTKYVST